MGKQGQVGEYPIKESTNSLCTESIYVEWICRYNINAAPVVYMYILHRPRDRVL